MVDKNKFQNVDFSEIRKTLELLLKEFDKKLNHFQTDVYAYLNSDGSISIDTFVNPGGNSWLNDDHKVIYRDLPHHNNIYDIYYCDIDDIAMSLDMEKADLKQAVAEYLLQDVEDIDYWDVLMYVQAHREIDNKLKSIYENAVDINEFDVDYDSVINGIIDVINEYIESAV